MKLLKTIFLAAFAIGFITISDVAQGNDVKLAGKYRVVEVGESKFKRGLEMVGREQDEYARHLTNFALGQIQAQKGAQKSLDLARRYIGLALHLSPKNRESVIANVQLSKGIMPKIKKKAFNKMTLATLLYVRGDTLRKQDGEANQLLAQAFVTLAAELNPMNEDAIYASAVLQQDYGKLDWNQFTGK